jgi:hypothetical protein
MYIFPIPTILSSGRNFTVKKPHKYKPSLNVVVPILWVSYSAVFAYKSSHKFLRQGMMRDFIWRTAIVRKTWSLTWREENIDWGCLREQGAEENIWTEEGWSHGGRRKLHNEELHNLYSSPSIIRINGLRRMRWAGHVVRMGEKRNAYRLLIGKQEWKRPLGRPWRRCVDRAVLSSMG